MKANIINRKQRQLLNRILELFVRSTKKKNFPNIEQLNKDLVHSMETIRTNYGKGQSRLSDLYELQNCKTTCAIEKKRGSYQIHFKGLIELLDTVYSYGRYGYRTDCMKTRLGYKNYKGEVKKGTVVPITGMAEYKLTKNGWEYVGHAVSMESALAPRF